MAPSVTGGRPDRAAESLVPRPLRTAVSGLWPSGEVALAVAAIPLATPNLTGAIVASVVRVTQSFEQIVPTLVAGPPMPVSGAVNVYTAAFDRQGRALASSHQTLQVVPRALTASTFEYEVVSRIELKPGRYELRTAVEDTRLGRSGSVYTYVDVPDYQRAAVALSGLLMSVTPGSVVVPDAALEGLVPVVPTTRRQFSASDRVSAFVRLYQGVSRVLMPGYVVAEILDDHDTSVYRQETRLASGQFGASRAVDFSVDVPVDRLAPGQYVLGVEARHGNETARRDVRFTVQ